MITKNASSYFSGADVFTTKSVKGFRSAILTIIAGEGDILTIGSYMTTDDTNPDSTKLRAYMYKDGVKQSGNVTINTAGIYTYVIDFDGATNLKVQLGGGSSYANSVIGLNLKQETYSTYTNNFAEIIVAYTWGKWIDVTKYNSAQLCITGIAKATTFACTGNPSNPREPAFDKSLPLYEGIAQISSIPANISTCVFGIDIQGIGTFKVDKTQAGAQSGTAYLLLSKNEYEGVPERVVRTNNALSIGTKNINSVIVDITIDGIAEGYTDCGIGVKDGNNNNLKYIANNVILKRSLYGLSAGTYRVLVDCKDVDSINISVPNATGYTISALPSVDEVDYSSFDDENFTYDKSYVFDNIKQIEVDVTDAKDNDRIYFDGSNDNFATTSVVSFINLSTNTNKSNYIILVAGNASLYANVEKYKQLRIRFVRQSIPSYNEIPTRISIKTHKKYKEGLTLPYWGDSGKPYAYGYRFIKFKFKESLMVNESTVNTSVKNCSPYLFIYNTNQSVQEVYDRGMNPIPSIEYGQEEKTVLFGTPVGDGYVVELDSPLAEKTSVGSYLKYKDAKSATGAECVVMFEATYYTEKPEPETYLEKVYEKADYEVYKLPSTNTNRDVLNHDVLEWEDNMLYFYRGGYLGVKYKIPFGSDNVKNYVTGEKIQFAYLLPFGGNRKRNVGIGNLYNPSRIVVFTKSRVYHNFPMRADSSGNNVITSDAQLFDESSIIMMDTKKWQPVNDKSKVVTRKRYFPVLAQYDYNQFEGRVAGTTGFEDTYGNGGLVNYLNRPWLDIPISGVEFWARLDYSSMAKGTKWCVFGNYNKDAGSEPLLIATNDGGRTWYARIYFGCTDYYVNMYGSKINLTPITDVAGAYVSGSLKMCRRRFNVPTPSMKEPDVPFVLNQAEQSLVTGFSVDADGDCLVTLADNVDYDGLNSVVYFENVSANSEWNYICNTGFTADGTTTNSGIFFRAQKVAANTYKLFADLGNQYEGDAVCRHIHAVNDCMSGFLVSTGETYAEDWFEGGFIYHLKQINRNGSNAVNPYSEGDVLRLCSSFNGVNRACGAYLFNDEIDPTLLYVSDQSMRVAEQRQATITGRTAKVPVTPIGIFMGKLSDIDDQTKFKCVCGLPVTITGLLQTHGHFAAQGHENAMMFSKDGAKWDIDVENGSHINGFDNYGNIYFGNKVAVFK